MTQEQKLQEAAKAHALKFKHQVSSEGLENIQDDFIAGAQWKAQQGWIYEEPPKDGTKIIRWHLVWSCPVCVFYRKPDNITPFPWVEQTRSNTWPEEAFSAGCYMPLTPPPQNK